MEFTFQKLLNLQDVGHVFPTSRVRPIYLPLRASHALQALNVTFVAPLASSEVYVQTRITFDSKISIGL